MLLIVVLANAGCNHDTQESTDFVRLNGRTMGTTYSISYASHGIDYQSDIDSLLDDVNMAVSTYIPESIISKFNRTGEIRFDQLAREGDKRQFSLQNHFMENWRIAVAINQVSDGAFDPTVGPLVNMWGFGWEGRASSRPDSAMVDSILIRVGIHHIYPIFNEGVKITLKDTIGVELDFSALAKGYGVDIVSEYLATCGVTNYFVEIGGEVRTSGLSPRGDKWRIGIIQPDPDADVSELYTRVALSNKSMATSGNYRNYYYIDGIRVWHTINPKTGYPESNPTLSATVVHARCIVADALATACMVMGPEEGIKMVADFPDAEAFILYNGQQEKLSN